MRVLVTGGAGFIGSTLIKALLARGDEVVCVDSLNDYYDPTLKRARLDAFRDSITFYQIDIADYAALNKVFAAHPFDAVAHLAAQAGVLYSFKNPEAYISANYVGTFNVFECAKQHGVKKIVFASTSSVYGGSKAMPFREDDPADKPVSLYAATKRSCEFLAMQYVSAYGMSITCLRFFTVYGPWGRPDMALFKFTKGILEGTPIDVYNGGQMNRDFTYVTDIVSGFVAALEKTEGFDIINLGHGKSEPLLHFIEIIEGVLGKKATKNMLPMQVGDVPATWADVSHAKERLGFSAKVSIEEGVPKFIEWYKEYYKV